MSNIIQSRKHPSKCSISSTYQNFELLYITKYIQSKEEIKYWQILKSFYVTGFFLQKRENIRKPSAVLGVWKETNGLTIACPKSTLEALVFIVNFEHISHFF